MTPGIQSNIAQLFEEQVARNAEVIAVVWGDSQLTYGELNARANRLARLLCARGVGLESPVGVYMDRSPEMITALLAVVKAGGCYLPLDTTYPKDRLAFMLRDTGAQLMITQAALAGQMDVEEVCLEDIACELDRQSGENLAHTASGENIVYIMYTSGSTGQPKGIEILHRGVASLVTNASYAPLTPQDSVAQLSNCAFDASTWEIWGSLLSGARLVGVNKETALSPQALASAIETQGITSMFVTTALFLLMAKEAPRAFRSLRHLLTVFTTTPTRRAISTLVTSSAASNTIRARSTSHNGAVYAATDASSTARSASDNTTTNGQRRDTPASATSGTTLGLGASPRRDQHQTYTDVITGRTTSAARGFERNG